MKNANCPSLEELSDFSLGRMPPDQLDVVDEHVQGCTDCQTMVESLETKSDTLVEDLRKKTPPDRFTAEPELAAVLAQAKIKSPSPTGGKPGNKKPNDNRRGQTAFDPYHKWLGISPDEQPPNHYRLLGIQPLEDDPDVIESAADRQMAHVRTFQTGKRAADSQKLLSEISRAKVALLNPEIKSAYDAQLRKELDNAQSQSRAERSGKIHWPTGRRPESVGEYEQCLVASRLLDATEIEQTKAGSNDANPAVVGRSPDRPIEDIKALATVLVRAGKITKFQAGVVFSGLPHPLVFGEYTILDKIGSGGMGDVFKARHKRMDRLAAIKILARDALRSPAALERFHQEVRAAARLAHPNIVTAYDAGEQDGVHYLVMEYVDGRDLASIVKADGPLPVEQAVDLMVQAADGLSYAHEQGIVHRDIKPGNLLLDASGKVKILDMGLARFSESLGTAPKQLTQSGQIMGTVEYMSPEQAEDTRHADHRADIYSLGCTLFRLLTGNTPYPGDTTMKVLIAHREEPVPSLCDSRPDVSPQLNAVVRRMLGKEPAQRQPSMAEVVTELKATLSASPGLPARPDSGRTAVAAPKRKEPTDSGLTALFNKVELEKDRKVASRPRNVKRSPHKNATPWFRDRAVVTVGVGGAVLAIITLLGVILTVTNGYEAVVRGGNDEKVPVSVDEDRGIVDIVGVNVESDANQKTRSSLGAPLPRRAVEDRVTSALESGSGRRLELGNIEDQTVDEGSTLKLIVQLMNSNTLPSRPRFEIDKGYPVGAAINADSGEFAWTPTEEQGPGTFNITVRASIEGSSGVFGETTFRVKVGEVNRAPVIDEIGNRYVILGEALNVKVGAHDLDLPIQRLRYELLEAPVGAVIDHSTGVIHWQSSSQDGKDLHKFRVAVSDGIPGTSECTASFLVVMKSIFAGQPLPRHEIVSVSRGDMRNIPRQLIHVFGDARLRSTGAIYDLAFSPDGKQIGASTSGGIMTWDVSTGGMLHRVLTADLVDLDHIAFTKDGEFIVTAGNSGFSICDLRQENHKSRTTFPRNCNAVWLSPDGTTLAAKQFAVDREIRLWDVKSGAIRHILKYIEPLYSTALAFRGDGQLLATENGRGVVDLWDTSTGQQATKFPVKVTHNIRVSGLALHIDEKLVLIMRGKDISVGNVPPGRESPHPVELNSNWIGFVSGASRSVGKQLAEEILGVGSDDVAKLAVHDQYAAIALRKDRAAFSIWNTRDRSIILKNENSPIEDACFHPELPLLLIQDTSGIELHDVLTGELMLDIPLTRIKCACFSPDGSMLFAETFDHNEFHIWDIGTREQLTSLDESQVHSLSDFCRAQRLTANTTADDWLPSPQTSSFAAKCKAEKGLTVWDKRTDHIVASISLPEWTIQMIRNVRFSSDGRFVVTVNAIGSVYLFDLLNE